MVKAAKGGTLRARTTDIPATYCAFIHSHIELALSISCRSEGKRGCSPFHQLLFVPVEMAKQYSSDSRWILEKEKE